MTERNSVHFWLVVLGSTALFLGSFFAFAQNFLDSETFKALQPDHQRAIKLTVKTKAVKTFLNHYPDWRAETYHDGGAVWHVDFYQKDEWLAFAHINVETKEVSDTKFPKKLSEEEFAERKKKVEQVVFNDPEVLALLVTAEDWDFEVQYDTYSEKWWMNFWRGIDTLRVDLYPDENSFHIDRVYDPKAFSEEKALRVARDRAVELAWQAEAIGEALDGVDNWHSYAEQQAGSVWSVSFDTSEKNLFSALVDIEAWEVLETQRGD